MRYAQDKFNKLDEQINPVHGLPEHHIHELRFLRKKEKDAKVSFLNLLKTWQENEEYAIRRATNTDPTMDRQTTRAAIKPYSNKGRHTAERKKPERNKILLPILRLCWKSQWSNGSKAFVRLLKSEVVRVSVLIIALAVAFSKQLLMLTDAFQKLKITESYRRSCACFWNITLPPPTNWLILNRTIILQNHEGLLKVVTIWRRLS